MRKAKIVCTLGPATDSVEVLSALIKAGMDVARINMSHGTHDEHAGQLGRLRQASEAVGKSVTVFADLQGPKIRLGTFAGPVVLKNGQRFTITTDDVQGDANRASTTLKSLTDDVRPGDAILIDDGNLTLKAVEVTATDVVCEVVAGGPVSDHKGINLPGVPVSVPALSDKDADDLRWALQQPVDLVALSFVRSAHDIVPVHTIMDEVGVRLPVIAKIEKPQAVHALEDVVDAFDAVMVARGDLGVEMPFEDVPLVQKRIITTARTWAKPVIVATQMLESMISAPRPTRAEASDVANAILDGADAVMLSGETAVGEYPVEAVNVMRRVIVKTEEHIDDIHKLAWDPHTVGGVISMAAVEVAERMDAAYLAAFTISGDTPHRLARLRSHVPIMAFTPKPRTAQELTLCWGVESHVTPEYTDTDAMVESVQSGLTELDLVRPGDRVVIVAGNPGGHVYQTNSLRLYEMA